MVWVLLESLVCLERSWPGCCKRHGSACARRSRNCQIISASGIVLLSVRPRNCRKLQEAAAVRQRILERVVGQIAALLQHQDLVHHDDSVRRPAALGARRARRRNIDLFGQRRTVDRLAHADKWIAQRRTTDSERQENASDTVFIGMTATTARWRVDPY